MYESSRVIHQKVSMLNTKLHILYDPNYVTYTNKNNKEKIRNPLKDNSGSL